MAYPRYTGKDGVENFTRNLVEKAGVLLLPASVYSSTISDTPDDRFRLGLGRSDIDDGLKAMHDYLQQQ